MTLASPSTSDGAAVARGEPPLMTQAGLLPESLRVASSDAWEQLVEQPDDSVTSVN